jgi:hypothetical protein
MNTSSLLKEVKKEIKKLQKIANLLKEGKGSGGSTAEQGTRKPMSAEGKAKISAAQKKRWAKEKKAESS